MDILPSIISSSYKIIYEKAYSALIPDYGSLAIRITDKNENNYHTSVRPEEWLISNPFGYGFWFEEKTKILTDQVRLMSDSVKPVRGFQSRSSLYNVLFRS